MIRSVFSRTARVRVEMPQWTVMKSTPIRASCSMSAKMASSVRSLQVRPPAKSLLTER